MKRHSLFPIFLLFILLCYSCSLMEYEPGTPSSISPQAEEFELNQVVDLNSRISLRVPSFEGGRSTSTNVEVFELAEDRRNSLGYDFSAFAFKYENASTIYEVGLGVAPVSFAGEATAEFSGDFTELVSLVIEAEQGDALELDFPSEAFNGYITITEVDSDYSPSQFDRVVYFDEGKSVDPNQVTGYWHNYANPINRDPDPNGQSCTDWYWVTTINGRVVSETYVFTTCMNEGSAGGGGSNSSGSGEDSNVGPDCNAWNYVPSPATPGMQVAAMANIRLRYVIVNPRTGDYSHHTFTFTDIMYFMAPTVWNVPYLSQPLPVTHQMAAQFSANAVQYAQAEISTNRFGMNLSQTQAQSLFQTYVNEYLHRFGMDAHWGTSGSGFGNGAPVSFYSTVLFGTGNCWP